MGIAGVRSCVCVIGVMPPLLWLWYPVAERYGSAGGGERLSHCQSGDHRRSVATDSSAQFFFDSTDVAFGNSIFAAADFRIHTIR